MVIKSDSLPRLTAQAKKESPCASRIRSRDSQLSSTEIRKTLKNMKELVPIMPLQSLLQTISSPFVHQTICSSVMSIPDGNLKRT
jgi:hypothetical protein